jgi:hypothetical protein
VLVWIGGGIVTVMVSSLGSGKNYTLKSSIKLVIKILSKSPSIQTYKINLFKLIFYHRKIKHTLIRTYPHFFYHDHNTWWSSYIPPRSSNEMQ